MRDWKGALNTSQFTQFSGNYIKKSMPASNKMLKKREQAANKANGLGDANGRMPSRVKATEQNASCTQCMQAIRTTKTNTEMKAHAESKHPKKSYAECFPGQH